MKSSSFQSTPKKKATTLESGPQMKKEVSPFKKLKQMPGSPKVGKKRNISQMTTPSKAAKTKDDQKEILSQRTPSKRVKIAAASGASSPKSSRILRSQKSSKSSAKKPKATARRSTI